MCKCNKKFDIGCVDANIEKIEEEWVLSLEYDAYSTDSSFYRDEVFIEIKYCPFCGDKL